MSYIKNFKHYQSATVVLFLMLFISSSLVLSQTRERAIRFSTPKIQLHYHPPLRAALDSHTHPSRDVPRLNLLVNLFENYIQYMINLNKIPPGVSLRMIYAPEIDGELWLEDSKMIRLETTGLENMLIQVNEYLKTFPETLKSELLNTRHSLDFIHDSYTRKYSEIASRLMLINYSSFNPALEPDVMFTVATPKTVVTARPQGQTNKLVKMTYQDGTCQSKTLLSSSSGWYSNLESSPGGKFLAFSINRRPWLLNIENPEVKHELFPGADKVHVAFNWSYNGQYLAGMVIDQSSQNRIFYVFDTHSKKIIDKITENTKSISNYIYPFFSWSPDSKKIILSYGRGIHIVDVVNSNIYPDVVKVRHEISEIIWSCSSNSLALVEFRGQSRDRRVFDDLDFRNSILRRYHLTKEFSAIEDHAQTIKSRNTIIPVCFWSLDRVLYVEGRLKSEGSLSPIVDLSSSFKAFASPTPTHTDESSAQKEPMELPMSYLYVYTNQNLTHENIFDAGHTGANYLYSDNTNSYWFLGLKKPDNIASMRQTFNMRTLPYPFLRNNITIISNIPNTKIKSFLDFLNNYNLRKIKFCNRVKYFYTLANFSGPLNLWAGEVEETGRILSD